MQRSRLTMIVVFVSILGIVTSTTFGHTHTHIGVNKDNIKGNADDAKLWIFATGSQHQWGTLEMTPTGDILGGMPVFKAELDCWHSAHPTHGGWQLGGADPQQVPGWQIGLRLENSSDVNNFWMEYEGNYFLKNINDQSLFTGSGARYWMADKYNENGELGAWGLHVHVEFTALAAGPGEEFSISVAAYDAGTTGFADSEPYTMTFVTVPEPAAVLLLTVGGLSILRRRK